MCATPSFVEVICYVQTMVQNHHPVTLKQVAEAAKVSRAAASFALSGKPGVAQTTRERILKIATELGYKPNQTAQNLRSSKTGTIAVYLPRNVTTMGYYMEATFGIVDEAEKTGKTVTLVPHNTVTPGGRLNADGLIILDPTAEDSTVAALLGFGMPVVTGEKFFDQNNSISGQVVVDHPATTRRVLDTFLAAGAQLPAIISTRERMAWSMSIEDSYLSWCREKRIEPQIKYTSIEGLAEDTRRATKELLTDDRTDAIFALTDGSALSVVAQLAESNRIIGRNFWMATAVDSPILQYSSPSVTAVDLKPRDFGQRCMALLSRILEPTHLAVSEPITEVFSTEIIFRDSTGHS